MSVETVNDTGFIPRVAEEADETATEAVPPVGDDDVEISEWLRADDVTQMVDRFVLRDGRTLKIAAITDREENQVRQLSMKVNPKNPRGPRVLDGTKYARTLIATSLNRANNSQSGAPNFVKPDQLSGRPTGELTSLMAAIMKLSGATDEILGDPGSDQVQAVFG